MSDNLINIQVAHKSMNLPTEPQCLDLFEQYKVPKHILKHCQKVHQASMFLAQRIKEIGAPINLPLVSALALCHDLFKAATFTELKPNKYHEEPYTSEEIAMWKKLREKYAGKYEGEIASEILKDQYPELAYSLMRVSDWKTENPSIEEMIVHYTDMRIMQEKVVSLLQRLEYLMERYPRPEEIWEQFLAHLRKVERELFVYLDFEPQELAEALEETHGQ